MTQWIATHSGKMFDYTNIDPTQINMDDIIYSLSNIPRFNGHTEFFYSVLQHSINVWYEICTKYPEDIELQIMALLHDAPEAYISDIPGPLKSLINKSTNLLTSIEYEVTKILWKRSGITSFALSEPKRSKADLLAIIHEYDVRMCETEADALFKYERFWNTGMETFPIYNISKEAPEATRFQFRGIYNSLVDDLKAQKAGEEPLLMRAI